jgi:hypothetical protein
MYRQNKLKDATKTVDSFLVCDTIVVTLADLKDLNKH